MKNKIEFSLPLFTIFVLSILQCTPGFTQKPDIPKISEVTSKSFRVNWQAYTAYDYSTHYQIGLNKALYGSSTLETTMFVDYLVGAATYSVEVMTFHQGKIVNISSPAIVLTCPTRPSSPRLVDVSSTTARIEWDKVSTAIGYQVYVGSQTYISTGGDQLNATLSGFSPGSKIKVSISAKNPSGYSDLSAPLEIQFLPPAPALKISPDEISQTSFILRWNDTPAAASFSAFLDENQIASLASSVRFYKFENLVPGSSHTARLNALNASGTISESASISVLLIPATPQKPWASSIATYSFILNWTPVLGATNYKVYRTADWLIENVSAPASSVVCQRGFNSGEIASISISASNSSGDSPKSEWLSVKLLGTFTPLLSFSFLEGKSARVGDPVSSLVNYASNFGILKNVSSTNLISQTTTSTNPSVWYFPPKLQWSLNENFRLKLVSVSKNPIMNNVRLLVFHNSIPRPLPEKLFSLMSDPGNSLRKYFFGTRIECGVVVMDQRCHIRAIRIGEQLEEIPELLNYSLPEK
ncbi:MAG: fibronectin type III domain-containing protein [Candidatus Riflebacteria bacterium]|nr:fibronectin type III domain-containing protein [Candidatus Riflebacteria bacterium]